MRKLDKELKRSITESELLKQKNVQLFTSNLNRFLEKHIPKIAKLPDGADALEAASVLGGLQSGLVQAGLPSVVSGIRTTYMDELSHLATRFDIAGFETSLSSFNSASVKALINNDTKRVTKLLTPYVDDISSTLLRTVISGELPDISALLGGTLDTLESQLNTELNTMISAFSRTATSERAKELDINLFLYLGPEDKLTRDFCLEVLNDTNRGIYTREEIDELDNEQDLPVFIYGGGYNCRHRWVAISEEDAREMGWKGEGQTDPKEPSDEPVNEDIAQEALIPAQDEQNIDSVDLTPTERIEATNEAIKADFLAQTKGNLREVGWAIDKDGNEIFRKIGNKNSVSIDRQEWDRLKGCAVFNHNHPNSYGFSDADMKCLSRGGWGQIRAIAPENPLLGSIEFIAENLHPNGVWSDYESGQLVRDFKKLHKKLWTTEFINGRDSKVAWADLNLKVYEELEKRHPIKFKTENKQWPSNVPISPKPIPKKRNLLG